MTFTTKLNAALAAADEVALDGYEVEAHEVEATGVIRVDTPCNDECESSDFDDQSIEVDESGEATAIDTGNNERSFSFTRHAPFKAEHLSEGVYMTPERIRALALANGFKLKPQPDGKENLNPYVYEFAAALQQDQASDIATLRSALIGLVGAETVDELKSMEAAMRLLPAPDADKAVYINAIHALIATIPKAEVTTDAEVNKEPAPIDMVLHCPKCNTQHIDMPNCWADEKAPCEAPTSETDPEYARERDAMLKAYEAEWTNPPHRSHLCLKCGHVWRPADVPTNGVLAINTKGKHDSA